MSKAVIRKAGDKRPPRIWAYLYDSRIRSANGQTKRFALVVSNKIIQQQDSLNKLEPYLKGRNYQIFYPSK